MKLTNTSFSLNTGREGNTSEYEPLANSMVVIMVRGLFPHLQFPYAQFPCAFITGDLLFNPLWEAVSRLEICGLKVMALTCDGASMNRRLFKLHQTGTQLVYKVVNPVATERYTYFFSDAPHLLKTVRNSWQSRKWHLYGQVISIHMHSHTFKHTYSFIHVHTPA